MPGIPKLRVPLEMGASGLRTVEQDSDEEVTQCVYAVAATPLGHLLADLDFGVEDPTFDQLPYDDGELLSAVARFEPRAEVRTGQEVLDQIGRVVAQVQPA